MMKNEYHGATDAERRCIDTMWVLVCSDSGAANVRNIWISAKAETGGDHKHEDRETSACTHTVNPAESWDSEIAVTVIMVEKKVIIINRL